MKRISMFLALVLTLGVIGPSFAAYTRPSDDQIEGLLANPQGLGDMVEDASPQEVADVVLRAIKKVEESTKLKDFQKQQIVAVLTAEAVEASQSKSPEVVTAIAKGAGDQWLPIIVAAGTTAAGRLSDDVLRAVLAMLGPDTPAAEIAQAAADDPVGTLGHGLHALVLRIVTPAAPGGLVPPPPPRYYGQ